MHGVIPLFDSPMILFQTTVEIFAGSMDYLIAQYFTHSLWVGGMSICRHPFRGMANHSTRLLEKYLGSLHIPFFAQARIHQVAICIDGPIEITPFPLDACS